VRTLEEAERNARSAWMGLGAHGAHPLSITRRGFTLIDVLVSIAVIAVLISLMLPSLGLVRETAHQVVCRSNARQIGLALAMYADERKDMIPSTVYVKNGGPQDRPAETVMLKLEPTTPGGPSAWDGLGRLFAWNYLPAGPVFYCPSHKGEHRYRNYEPQWLSRPGGIMGNYQYRGMGPPPMHSMFLNAIEPARTALVCDSMRNQADFNHEVGANVLRADLSVFWYRDNGQVFSLLHAGDQSTSWTNMNSAWSWLDGRE
jgi:prepilin-type N-terminal cleavage/methylation domain-containing protein